jgi:hypothetical protein
MNRTDTLASAIIAATLVLLPATASADPGGKGGKSAAAHDKGVSKGKGAPQGGDNVKKAADHRAVDTRNVTTRRVVRVVRPDDFFDRNEEALVRRYFGTVVACPPGLAAKNNGCLPPGQAKKTYRVGNILPREAYLTPLPGDLLGRLPVAPSGYYYGRYNGDVYLIENSTRRVVDTILFNLLR